MTRYSCFRAYYRPHVRSGSGSEACERTRACSQALVARRLGLQCVRLAEGIETRSKRVNIALKGSVLRFAPCDQFREQPHCRVDDQLGVQIAEVSEVPLDTHAQFRMQNDRVHLSGRIDGQIAEPEYFFQALTQAGQ